MRTETRKIFIYSDPHFGHKNVIKYANRPFSNINEMNSQLIKNFNKVVGHDDVVYILGDFSFLNTISTTEILKSLNGYKFLIKGNHDRKTNTAYRKMGFTEVYDKPIVLMNFFILSHEPIDENVGNMINIYGHLHQNGINSYMSYCACVEKTDYKPVSLDEVEDTCNKLYKRGEI